MDSVNKLVKKFSECKNRKIRKIYTKILIVFFGLDIGIDAKIGKNVNFKHGGLGTVIHTCTAIDDNVMIMSGVTVGRSDVWIPRKQSKYKGVHIMEGAIIGTGAKILGKEEVLTIGKNTIIGANSVLLESTGDNEIWGGIPAKFIKKRSECLEFGEVLYEKQ